MATVTMMAPPARLPFGSLDGARIRNMTNIKNKQNALASTTPSALKRHAPAEFDIADSENIDPLVFFSSSKKSRCFDSDLTKSNNVPLFAAPTNPAQYVERAQPTGQKRKAEDTETISGTKRCIEKSSAPAPAGRSPKNKRIGILSRHRMTNSAFTRVNPPSSSDIEPTNGVPFSIDAALAGTVSKCEPKSTHKNGWYFDIYEDTEDDESTKLRHSTNLMEHSTCILNISIDESSLSKGDEDNKENISPIDGYAAMASASRDTTTTRDIMTDETRSPLGDLDAKEFYAEGSDGSPSCQF